MTPVSEAPVLELYARMTLFVASTVKPFPTHKAWSGGSSENWLPPFASRCSRPLRPSNPSAISGFEPATGLGDTVGASSGFFGNLPFLKPGRGRLTAMSPSSSSSKRGRSSGFWMAPLPVPVSRIEVVPALGTSRVPCAAFGAADAAIAKITVALRTPLSASKNRPLT